ncbi:MAG: hypothetical protein JW954_02415 [Dehalococcoidaceae bacterium]|nr:hypothetical protein [Dehalococcoidaceae bacterium]
MSDMFLTDALNIQRDAGEARFHYGRVNINDLIAVIRTYELSSNQTLVNEKAWTFLVGFGYSLSGETGINRLSEILTNSDILSSLQTQLWLEALPLPPRRNEGNTSIDLALGAISKRGGTKGGIELAAGDNTWVCFCEMKFNSDIASGTTQDCHRNQLLRVIENALCFQASECFADKLFVTLVTPAVFKNQEPKNRLYQYKYEEYKNEPAVILQELDKCRYGPRQQTGWLYPSNMKERIKKLELNWVTYEDLFDNMPIPEDPSNSEIVNRIKKFWESYCSL